LNHAVVCNIVEVIREPPETHMAIPTEAKVPPAKHRGWSIVAPVIISLRPHQWVKNALVFVPLVLGGKAGDPTAWKTAAIGFVALCFAASASYVINDLRDLAHDRTHPTKRLRPLASGDLSVRAGILVAAVGLAVGFAIAATIGRDEVALLSLYVAGAISYSFLWKRLPIVDVFVIACLFTFRLGLGIMLVDVRVSPWLLIFSMFLFLSLSGAKRYTELLRLISQAREKLPGRGYVASDAPLVLALGIASMLGAVLILIVYLLEDAFPRAVYGNTTWLWTIPPILFLFLGRIWLLSQRGQMLDDPVAFALRDRVSLFYGIAMGLGFAAALYGVRF
jgi:4-hydroxybenzoate polyprenyltransferase